MPAPEQLLQRDKQQMPVDGSANGQHLVLICTKLLFHLVDQGLSLIVPGYAVDAMVTFTLRCFELLPALSYCIARCFELRIDRYIRGPII
jgi:hypothetical protein